MFGKFDLPIAYPICIALGLGEKSTCTKEIIDLQITCIALTYTAFYRRWEMLIMLKKHLYITAKITRISRWRYKHIEPSTVEYSSPQYSSQCSTKTNIEFTKPLNTSHK